MFSEFSLSEQEIEEFQKIHSSIIPKRQQKFKKYSIWEKTSKYADKDISIYNKINPIILKSIDILNHLNIKDYDFSKFNIEFHQRNCGFENEKYQPFTWHSDDYATTHYKVYTILYYIRKDKTVNGGNLKYISNKTKETFVVDTGKVFIMRGDVRHKPESTSGFGCRDAIICFIKRI